MPSTVTQDNIILTLIEVICQTIMYGVFIVVMPILLHTLTTRKTRGPNSIMLWCTLCTFALASAHWAASVAALVAKISGSHEHRNSVIRTMFNAVVFLNFIFADTVVVWRMRVLCTSYIPSKVLLIPVMLLVITSFSVCAVVGLRIVITASPGNEARGGPLVEAINIAQTSGISFSLLSNIVATSIIGVWAWQIQKLFRTESADTGKGARITRAQRVVILLLESGSLYCISSILLLVSTLIRLPVGGTLGDIYTPVHVQISGIFPALVIILAQRQADAGTTIMTSITPPQVRLRYTATVVEASPSHPHPTLRFQSRGTTLKSREGDDYGKFVLTTGVPSPDLHLEDMLSLEDEGGERSG